jgi:hypothetical protein
MHRFVGQVVITDDSVPAQTTIMPTNRAIETSATAASRIVRIIPPPSMGNNRWTIMFVFCSNVKGICVGRRTFKRGTV